VRAEIKLPVLYLIDSIVKNVGDVYTSLFTQNIVSTFCGVFEKVLHILIFFTGDSSLGFSHSQFEDSYIFLLYLKRRLICEGR
jgi:hypothetical protein